MHISKVFFWLKGLWRPPQYFVIPLTENIRTQESTKEVVKKKTFENFGISFLLKYYFYVLIYYNVYKIGDRLQYYFYKIISFIPTSFSETVRTFGLFKRFVFERLKVSDVFQKISYTMRPLTDFMRTAVSLKTRVSKVIVDNVRVSLNMLSSVAKRLYDSFKITDAVSKISFVRRIVFDATKVSDVIRKNVLLSRIEGFKVSETLSSSLYILYCFIVYDFFRTGDYIRNIFSKDLMEWFRQNETIRKVYMRLSLESFKISEAFKKMIRKMSIDSFKQNEVIKRVLLAKRFSEMFKQSDFFKKTYQVMLVFVFKANEIFNKILVKRIGDFFKNIVSSREVFLKRAYDILSSKEYIFFLTHYLRTFVEKLSISFSAKKTFTKTVYSFIKTSETLKLRFAFLLSDFMHTIEDASKTFRTLFTETISSMADLIWRAVIKLREHFKTPEIFISFSFREVLKIVIVGLKIIRFKLIIQNMKAYNFIKKILKAFALLLEYKR